MVKILRMRSVLFFFSLVFSFLIAHAQQSMEIQLGDTVPDIKFTKVVNSQVVKLSELEGKIVIIDFWSRGCGSCIASFPAMELLSKKYSEKIVIVAVTKDSYQQFEKIRLNSKIIKESQLPFVTGDTVLNSMFPHRYVPYYVWINSTGRFLGTSTSITEEKIENVINTGILNEYVVSKERVRRIYYNYETEKMGLRKSYWGDKTVFFELRKLTDREFYERDFYLTQLKDSGSGETFGRVMHGTYLLDILRSAFANIPQVASTIEFLNGDMFEYFPPKDEKSVADWQRGRRYHFKMIAEPGTYKKFKARDLMGIMQLALEQELGIRGKILTSETNCYVLRQIRHDTTRLLLTKHPAQHAEEATKFSIYIRNGIMRSFISMLSAKLNSTRRRDLPFINESNYSNNDLIDIDLTIGDKIDIDSINKALEKYNLVVEVTNRELPALFLDVGKHERERKKKFVGHNGYQ